MIRIERPRGISPYSPAILERGVAKVRQYFELDPLLRRQRREPVQEEWRVIRRVALEAVRALFRGKCAYCESAIGPVGTLEVDHFRPKFGAAELGGDGSLDHYCWLTLEWENHYASCAPCNRAKRSFFPVQGARADYGAPLEKEMPLLIDPCRDDPAQHLEFVADGTVRALSLRGETTIKVCNLNRTPLAEARRAVFELTLRDLPHLGKIDVDGLIAKGQPYIAVIRAAIASVSGQQHKQSLSAAVPEEKRSAAKVIAEDAEAFRLTARSLQSVEIVNFKLVRHMAIRLPEPGGERAPWLMMLGENASGKSTVLQAIGLALAGADEANRFLRPSQALTTGTEEGHIELRFWDNEVPVTLYFRRGAKSFEGTRRPSAIVLGYGALRYPARQRADRSRGEGGFARLAPLLRPVARIPHSARWFASLDDAQFAVAARCLRDLLPIGDDTDVVRGTRSVLFRIGDHVSRLEDMSSGYQTMVGVSADIMQLLFERWNTLASAAGIVLIDELDAHLHPRWKMRIVRSLREAFPQVQFIASTHDPLVLRGIRNGEVAVLRRDAKLGAVIDQDLPPIEGMQVDELLTSRHFGLESTLDPDVEARLTELYHLQSLPCTEQGDARIAELRAGIGDRTALGRNRREQIMLQVADAYIKAEPEPAEAGQTRTLSEATVSRLQALIDRAAGKAA